MFNPLFVVLAVILLILVGGVAITALFKGMFDIFFIMALFALALVWVILSSK